MPSIRAIHAFHTGLFRVPRFFNARGGGWYSHEIPVLCFAIEADEGFVLVDAGYGSTGPRTMGWARAWAFRSVGRMRFRPEWGCRERLASIGVGAAGRLLAAAMTHLHIDHTGGLREAAPPRVLVAEDEWAAARAPGSFVATFGPYAPADYGPRSGMAVEPVRLARPAPPELAPFEAAADLFGDGSVLLVALPGHSPGHAGVHVRLADGARVLLCGDAAFTVAETRSETEPGLFPRLVAHDRARMLDTLERLRAFARANPGVAIVPSHDPGVGAAVAAGPAVIAGTARSAAVSTAGARGGER